MSAFRRGSTDAADFAAVPAQIGVRLIRTTEGSAVRTREILRLTWRDGRPVRTLEQLVLTPTSTEVRELGAEPLDESPIRIVAHAGRATSSGRGAPRGAPSRAAFAPGRAARSDRSGLAGQRRSACRGARGSACGIPGQLGTGNAHRRRTRRDCAGTGSRRSTSAGGHRRSTDGVGARRRTPDRRRFPAPGGSVDLIAVSCRAAAIALWRRVERRRRGSRPPCGNAAPVGVDANPARDSGRDRRYGGGRRHGRDREPRVEAVDAGSGRGPHRGGVRRARQPSYHGNRSGLRPAAGIWRNER